MALGDMPYQSVVVVIPTVFALPIHILARQGVNKEADRKSILFRQIFNCGNLLHSMIGDVMRFKDFKWTINQLG
jgi:hypothetical protein